MARNLKPRHKASRKYSENIADTLKDPLAKKNYPSGVHGPKRSFAKVSEYGRQLLEKQKAKAIYGIMEKQFVLTFNKAQKLPGDIGINFLTTLELRLDNVIYRAGFAQTRRMARQLVNHGHFLVDDVKTDIPSYQVKPGQIIKVKENKVKNKYWQETIENMKKLEREVPGWVAVDTKAMTVSISGMPNKDELPQNIETRLIVDFYSR